MRNILVLLVFLSSILIADVDANLNIIKKISKIPKVVVSISNNTNELDVLKKIETVLKKDLNVSGHFEVVDNIIKVSYELNPDSLSLSQSGVDLYINLFAKKEDNGNYNLSFKLFDINQKKLVLEKTISTSSTNRYPFLAHRSAIAINDFFNAPSIDWMDKFVVFSVYKSAKSSDILIGDYTLTYKKAIVKGGLNIFPKWANNKQEEIYFTSYSYDRPTLVKLNIFTRKKQIIMQSDGMLVCSDVKNDGSKLLITAAPDSQPDIYLYDVATKSKKRVTRYRGIDVGAQFVDDDSKIVFVSDRLGYPNIFAKAIDSTAVERLVYHSKNNTAATTFKDNIIYSSRDKKSEFEGKIFNLYWISTKSSFLKKLTSTGINQFPKFSSDGETLLFIKNQNGISSLGIIRLKFDKIYLFPLSIGRIQSIDW